MEGLQHRFLEFVDQELLDLIFLSLRHTNRFVRETGYYVCASIVASGEDAGTVLKFISFNNSRSTSLFGYDNFQLLGNTNIFTDI